MEYIAHINEITGKLQSVEEHNENVAELSSSFSIPELSELCYAIGKMHDIGKFCDKFQKKIRGEQVNVDHSTAGAVVMEEICDSFVGVIAQLCIAGHHTGIPDTGLVFDEYRDDISSTLYSRIKRKRQRCTIDSEENYDAYRNVMTLPNIEAESIIDYILRDCNNPKDDLINKIAFITRYCFSCLVDADSIDTVLFCGTRNENQLKSDFKKCLEKVNKHLNSFICKTELQKARKRLQEQAFSKIDKDAEVYLLNMPTGSGKTLCSIKFALERAIKKEKKRIIYVIPYNNIIDQTVTEFERIFGNDVEILRHQSSYSYEDDNNIDEDYRIALKNGIENWDVNSIIVTTAVQFFESMYSNKRGKLRKMHNISDSILIFDEAHLMPMEYLQPCLQAVSYATKYLNSEALFLTATMPDFQRLLNVYTGTKDSQIVNLIDETKEFRRFNKCRFYNLNDISSEKLMNYINQTASVLVVTNSKKAARHLYDMATGKKYYLSTYLTGVDRKRIITEIKAVLKKLEEDFPALENIPEERKIKVFSTSLIEAGVDLDFQNVFRESTGLDSILQSGGRCNREGKREHAVTYIFSLSDEEAQTRETEASNLAKGMFDKYENIQDVECIKEYYNRLYGMNLDKLVGKTMSHYCEERNLTYKNIPFKSYAEDFNMIDNKTESIVVPQDENSRKTIESIKYNEFVSSRSLQKYTCTVSKSEFEELIRQHVVDDYGRGIWCLTNENYYSNKTGISLELTDYFL